MLFNETSGRERARDRAEAERFTEDAAALQK